MFSKVIITGDVLRPFPNGQGGWESATWRNIQWLWSLVSTHVHAMGAVCRMAAWNPRLGADQGLSLPIPQLYQACGVELSLSGWARLMADPLPPMAQEMLLPALSDALVVGYELPDPLIQMLCRHHIPFVDVILHPIRFLDDLAFALRSNHPQIHRLLCQHTLDTDEVWQKAALIQAKSAWMPPPLPQPMPADSVLLLGQVGIDRALLRGDGGFHSLADHGETLAQLCRDHPKVFFKPHPYDLPASPTQSAVRQHKSIQWIQGNFYHLLCQPEISRVVALNSSGLTEAAFFHTAATRLLPADLYDFGTQPPVGPGPGQAVPQDGQWIGRQFWSALLTGRPCLSGSALPPQANRLRRAMNADWGYGLMDHVVVR